MNLIRLPNTATAEEVSEALALHGYVIVDELISPDVIDAISHEMGTYVDSTTFASDEFFGMKTKRSGSLVARSPTAREVIMNPMILATARKFLAHSSSIRLHLTQVISVYPGSPAQMLHQDEAAWDLFPFPKDYHVQCNLLCAMSDYTEENGATRIVPNSQYAGAVQKYAISDSVAAVMKKGSVLFYTGKVYHGAGENKTSGVRQALNLTYAVGWVRQEENQYLSTPVEIAKTLPTDLLKLMGYDFGAFGLGYVFDFKHPLSALGRTPDSERSVEMLSKNVNAGAKHFGENL
ncbi:phytanoyl-CoA dioxygenase family protein [Pseudomonas luteola]|uniref:phytanoyl-CoA dioxygenase family protein n=1 Tax=Pseudomonas luteola TaxID=47886 RepID=UPI001239ABA0|nr:phytanoyl-CoA dioxygenase family protein [Pseudomonas luteola]QEU26318.1 phytanoyl-CoA dioxygenase family protein [Pseudomonas luteola]